MSLSLSQPCPRIFSGRDEIINLIAPLVFLPLVVAEMVLGAPALSVRIFLLNFIEVGLGSAGHNGLSWGLLFLTPEGRLWLRDKGGRRQILKMSLISLSIFLFAATIFCFFLDEGGLVLKTYLAIDWFLIHHHSLNQTKGLSMMYSFHSPSDSRSPELNPVHRQKQYAFHALLFLAQIPMLNYIFDFPILTTWPEKWGYAIVTSAVVLWILRLNLRLPDNQRNRLIYLSRLFYFPLTSFWFTAALAFRVLHGVEYLFVYRKILAQSKKSLFLSRRALIGYSFLFFFIAVGLWTFSTVRSEGFLWLFPQDGKIPMWLRIMAALSVTRLYTHYYLDRQLFRMRDPITKKWIGRLVGDSRSA